MLKNYTVLKKRIIMAKGIRYVLCLYLALFPGSHPSFAELGNVCGSNFAIYCFVFPLSSHGLKVLSWNIDGRDEEDIQDRTESVCDFIAANQPDVVYLQEVVSEMMGIIGSKLDSSYEGYTAHSPPAHYYPAILVRKSSIQVQGSLECYDFHYSSMGRHLLQLPVKFSELEIQLMTSHLESLKDYARERKDQLKYAFEIMEELQASKICIFGGDLNVRDDEVGKVGLPDKTVDVWEACGSNEEEKYTWDATANDNLNWSFGKKLKMRFDRVYLSPSDGKLRPKGFSLVGKERLSRCGRFPSDHWGLWMEFGVEPSSQSHT